MTILIVVAATLFLLVIVIAILNRKSITLAAPRLGLLNLIGDSVATVLQEDRDAIREFFYEVSESAEVPPECDVLFLYALLGTDGSITGSSRNLRQIIADSGAKIVVIASENPGERYIPALKLPGEGRANLVMTIERRGWRFGSFYKKLFEGLSKGLIMPVVWARLAPQRPGDPHDDCPSSIFAAELGGVKFKRA